MDTSEGLRCLDQQLIDTPCDRDRMCQTGYCDPDSNSCQEIMNATTESTDTSSCNRIDIVQSPFFILLTFVLIQL